MRIKSARVSNGIFPFKKKFLTKYRLGQYNPNEPTIFFGCYPPKNTSKLSRDLRAILNHKSLGVIVWTGSDAMRINRYWMQKLKRKSNIKHIAISSYIIEDLQKFEVPHFHLPICPTNLSANARDSKKRFLPCSLGDCIYTYSSHVNPVLYGEPIVKQLQKLLPQFRFIIGYAEPPRHYSNMRKVYSKCFIGLRLVQHDGLPNTVIEMGLMGRRCIWNGGGLPNAIHWKNLDDIVSKIITESKLSKKQNDELSIAVKKYLNIGSDWLNTEFYED